MYNVLCPDDKVMLLSNYTVTLFIARPLVWTAGRCFRLASERDKCLRTHPQVYHFAYVAIESAHFTVVMFLPLFSFEIHPQIRVQGTVEEVQ